MTSDEFQSAKRTLFQELGALQERLRSLSERLDVKRQQIRENYRRELELITSDKAVAYGYLQESDPSLRLLALEALACHWTPDEVYYKQCERLAAEDPEGVVRASVLRRLAERYAGTSNRRLMTLAARAARDNRDTESFAFGAYRAFCLIAGIKMRRPERLSDVTLFYVDWDVMKPFYQASDSGGSSPSSSASRC
jgi:hypothetical protein